MSGITIDEAVLLKLSWIESWGELLVRCHTLVASATALLMSGCSLFAGNDDASAPVVQPVETQPVPEQVVRPKLRSTRVAVALLKPTNPDERLRVVKSGRADPFARLVSLASPKPSGSAPAEQGSRTADPASTDVFGFLEKARQAFSPPANPSPSVRTRVVVNPTSTGTRLPASSPSGSPSDSSQSVARLPPLPQPDLAKKVQVTGIALVGGVPRAIVQAPNETTSRSVGPGDTLSNGQILVKRIDLSNPAEPFVVLEQVGAEVVLGVGKAAQLASAPTNLPVVPGLWYDNQK